LRLRRPYIGTTFTIPPSIAYQPVPALFQLGISKALILSTTYTHTQQSSKPSSSNTLRAAPWPHNNLCLPSSNLCKFKKVLELPIPNNLYLLSSNLAIFNNPQRHTTTTPNAYHLHAALMTALMIQLFRLWAVCTHDWTQDRTHSWLRLKIIGYESCELMTGLRTRLFPLQSRMWPLRFPSSISTVFYRICFVNTIIYLLYGCDSWFCPETSPICAFNTLPCWKRSILWVMSQNACKNWKSHHTTWANTLFGGSATFLHQSIPNGLKNCLYLWNGSIGLLQQTILSLSALLQTVPSRVSRP